MEINKISLIHWSWFTGCGVGVSIPSPTSTLKTHISPTPAPGPSKFGFFSLKIGAEGPAGAGCVDMSIFASQQPPKYHFSQVQSFPRS